MDQNPNPEENRGHDDSDFLDYLSSMEEVVVADEEMYADIAPEKLDGMLRENRVHDDGEYHDSNTLVKVEEAILSVLAFALRTNLQVQRARQLMLQVRNSEVLFRALGDAGKPIEEAVVHALAITGDMESGPVDMHALGLLDKERVSAVALSGLTLVSKAPIADLVDSTLTRAKEDARVYVSAKAAARFNNAVMNPFPVAERVAAYKNVVANPPTALDEGGDRSSNDTVAEMLSKAADQSVGKLTMSSGFPSLDANVSTLEGQEVGYVRSGQLVVFVAPSGSGKTSAFNTIVPAGVQDIVNQGHRGNVIYIHNEDETSDLFENMGIYPGSKFQHLQHHMVATKTSSREEVVKLLYREIRDAQRASVSKELPIHTLVPPAIFIDYFQALTAEMDGGNEVTATANTADLLLNGFANLDPVAIKKFSGISYEEYTGEAWPAGLEGTEMCVITTAQLLLKGNSAQSPFDPERHDWRGYAAANAADEPAWDLQPGDFPMAKLDDIRGSTKIIQHATLIIGLHRSRSRNNPGNSKTPEGYNSLQDTRGFFTILKTRNGQKEPVCSMEFNLQRNGGKKAQYIDSKAEAFLHKLDYDVHTFKVSGDPIVPRREKVSKMSEVNYF